MRFLPILLLAVLAVPANAAPKVLGRTESGVRVLKPHPQPTTPQSQPRQGEGVALDGPPPSSTAPEAVAAAKKLVEAYGGRAAVTAWIQHGERRGRQFVYTPAHVEAAYVERRAPGKLRLDLETAGLVMSLADGPAGGWQRFLGLVSDLPEAQKEELVRSQAHDEGLLLAAAKGEAAARVVPEGLVIWGPSGSATLFVPGDGVPLKEIRFLERSALRDDIVPQA